MFLTHHCISWKPVLRTWYTPEKIQITICEGWDILRNHTPNQYDDRHGKFRPCISKTLSHHYEKLPMGKGRNRKITRSKSHLQQQIKLVNTNYCSTKRWWRKAISYWLQSFKQGYKEVHLAHAKGRRHILETEWYFTLLDLRAGYHHIPLDKSSIPKTAFNLPFRKYKYVKVPFGLAQAPAYFQELITGIPKDFNFAIAYLDDIIIFSKTPEEQLSHIRKVFEKLHSAKLSMKLSKCHFFSKEIQYLGHILSSTGIQPLPSKTHAIQHITENLSGVSPKSQNH